MKKFLATAAVAAAAIVAFGIWFEVNALSASLDAQTATKTLLACGAAPDAVRKAPYYDLKKFEGLAVVSAVMDHNRNMKLLDDLTAAQRERADSPSNPNSTSTPHEHELAEDIWTIAGHAAECGAAYGVVKNTRG